MSSTNRRPLQRIIYNSINCFCNFVFSKELTSLIFCEHLTDFCCFHSYFFVCMRIFLPILLKNLLKLLWNSCWFYLYRYISIIELFAPIFGKNCFHQDSAFFPPRKVTKQVSLVHFAWIQRINTLKNCWHNLKRLVVVNSREGLFYLRFLGERSSVNILPVFDIQQIFIQQASIPFDILNPLV